MRLMRALVATAVLLGLVAGVPLLLVAWVGSPWPDGGWTSVRLMTDSAVLGLLALVGWVLWTQFVLCLLTQLVAEVRRVPVPQVGPRAQREMARGLIRAALLVGATGSIATTTWQPMGAADASFAVTSELAAVSAQQGSFAQTTVQPSAAVPGAATHLVEPGDTLWGIAERRLGDGLRWRQIADLNHGRTMTDGSVFHAAGDIRPGWKIEVPSEQRAHTSTVTVRPGDTLSDIAKEELGQADRWPALYRANRATVGPDPDVIQPGQRLNLPGDRATVEERPAPPPLEATPPPTTSRRLPDIPSQPVAPHDASPPPEATAGPEVRTDDEVPVTEVTRWRAVLATGSCLAVGLFGLLVANRRRQIAARRPGRAVRLTPQDLRPLERAIYEVGSDREADVAFIDLGLRSLSCLCHERRQPLPNLGAAVLGTEGLTLKLVGLPDSPPPSPWEKRDDDTWFLPRTSELPDDGQEHPAPYPALVATGTDGHGRLWLLDLEVHGGAGLSLPPGLLRHWVTELAANPWGSSVELLVADRTLAPLATLNPERVTVIGPDLATRRARALQDDASGRFASLLDLRRDDAVADATGPVVILGTIADEYGSSRGRDRVILLANGCRELLTHEDGQWSIVDWDVPIEPFELDRPSFEAMAALLGDTEDVSDTPEPGQKKLESGPPRDGDAWSDESLLPAPDRAYLAVRDEVTREDLARLAPRTTQAQRAETLALDPALDRDLADWHDPVCSRPKVKVLGPVDVTAITGSRDGIRNVGGTIEFIVYLALAERGVTKNRAAEDLGWSGATVQNRARDARRIMGLRPDGTDWLPDAARSAGARLRGVPTYQLHPDVLLDADLLRRLRARAQATGPDGVGDVEAALRLVEGDPFEQLRKGGYGWLLEGDRADLQLVAAIDDLRLIRELRESA